MGIDSWLDSLDRWKTHETPEYEDSEELEDSDELPEIDELWVEYWMDTTLPYPVARLNTYQREGNRDEWISNSGAYRCGRG